MTRNLSEENIESKKKLLKNKAYEEIGKASIEIFEIAKIKWKRSREGYRGKNK